jgi:hypothetical protein
VLDGERGRIGAAPDISGAFRAGDLSGAGARAVPIGGADFKTRLGRAIDGMRGLQPEL